MITKIFFGIMSSVNKNNGEARYNRSMKSIY
jgi:hypothetical protein